MVRAGPLNLPVRTAAALLPRTHYSIPPRISPPQSFTAWMTGMPAEFSDPRFPSYGEGREGERQADRGGGVEGG